MKKIIVLSMAFMFLGSGFAYAGEYLNSAHGTQNDAITGANRLNSYTDGHCNNCHEQHASIDGSEPSPTGGPDNYLLFDTSHTDQTANFCFDCHVDTGSQQLEGSQSTVGNGYIHNYSYAYRAGNYNDGIDDIKETFALTSSHNLDNIVTFISGKWGYTASSNPCCACHNPHAARGDPAGSTSAKSDSSRGYPVARPSLHVNLTSWGLWGDASGEKMSDYVGASTYQAPYRYYTTLPSSLEPQGDSLTEHGSATAAAGTTDYVTFCLDCHSSALTSTTLGRTTKIINWDNSFHGKADAAGDTTKRHAPYNASEKNYVLACTDCHEPHGSPNLYLIRKEVNGASDVALTGNNRIAWDSLCDRCHTSKLTSYCTGDDGATLCSGCHYHGKNF